MSLGRVTLVVACYNHAHWLERALTSAFAQDHPDFEVIITDDASPDGSADRVKGLLAMNGWHARTVFNAVNLGITTTFNKALTLVNTPYVAFLAADDWQRPDRLRRQAEHLDTNPSAAFSYGPVTCVELSTGRRSPYQDLFPGGWPGGTPTLYDELLQYDFIPAPSLMFRTDALRSVGGYDESLAVEDHDVLLRLTRVYQAACLAEPLVFYQVHESSFSRAMRDRDTLLNKLATYEKQLGHNPVVDRRIRPRMFAWAVGAYKLGARPREVRHHFERLGGPEAPNAALYRALTGLRVPGRAVAIGAKSAAWLRAQLDVRCLRHRRRSA